MGSHPGETLRFLMLEEGLLAGQVAARTGLDLEQVHAVLAGALPVSPEIAAALARLGSIDAADTWLRLQASHDAAPPT